MVWGRYSVLLYKNIEAHASSSESAYEVKNKFGSNISLNSQFPKYPEVKFPYWGVFNYADSLWINISPIFYIANANPNPAGPSTPQYGNDSYPVLNKRERFYVLLCTFKISKKGASRCLHFAFSQRSHFIGCDVPVVLRFQMSWRKNLDGTTGHVIRAKFVTSLSRHLFGLF